MAEVYETANASIDKRSDVDDKPILSKFWLGEIAAAKKRDQSWHQRADKVIARYRDERDQDRAASAERRANILWSNTETLKSALFQGLGNPDVRRRFAKKGDDDRAARQAALSLERSLSYCADAYDAESQIDACIEDYLLPGRGTGWLVYDANVSDAYSEAGEDGSVPPQNGAGYPSPQGGGYQQPAGPQITHQSVRIDHVFYKDFLTSAGRKWSDVWWCARGHDYSRDELQRYWPKHAEKIPLNVSITGYDNSKKGSKDEEDTFKRARVWEIWDKSKSERVYVAEDYDLVLDAAPDPYKLKDFFPTVEPLYAVKTTSSLVPIPEYTLYQDQAEELDILQTRLCRITDALKRRGVYDGTMEGPDNQLSQLAYAGDNQFVPIKNFAALMEKGGLKNVFQSEDLAPFVVVLEGLSAREQALLQKIYEITGISDILRGASDPNETATAQRIKGQFGSLRLQKRQKRIQVFIRDFYRLKAEIIAEHFTREQIVEMTGIDMPLKAEQEQAKMMLAAIQQREQQAKAMAQQGQGAVQAPPPVPPRVMQKLIATAKAVTWEEIAAILRSDQRRGYKVDVETDATNAIDSETEKAQRIEFLTAMSAFLEKVLVGVREVPQLATLAKELSSFAVGAFRVGRTLEESFEDAFEQIEQMAQAAAAKGPQPDPEEKKAMLEAKAREAEFAFKAKEAQQSQQLDQQKFAHQSKLQEQEQAHKQRLAEAEMQQEARLAEMKAAQEQQFRAMEFEANQQAAQQKMAFDTQNMERQAAFKQQESDRAFALKDRQMGQAEASGMRQEGFEREKFDRTMAQGDAQYAAESGGEVPPMPADNGVQSQLAQLSHQVAQLTQMLAAMMGGGQPMAQPAQ